MVREYVASLGVTAPLKEKLLPLCGEIWIREVPFRKRIYRRLLEHINSRGSLEPEIYKSVAMHRRSLVYGEAEQSE